jgi:peptide/nickel transport system permease protein
VAGNVTRRLLAMLAVLVLLSLVVFFVQTSLPGDPARAYAGRGATDQRVEEVRQELGYDQPVPVQYWRFLGRLAQGDLGESLRTRQPVAEDIGDALPATIELALAATVLMLVLGTTMGVLSAQGGRLGRGTKHVMVALSSAPTFLLGIIAVIVLYKNLRWFPAVGRLADDPAVDGPTGLHVVDGLLGGDLAQVSDAFRHLVLPAFCLAIGPAVAVGRVLRGELVAAQREDYVRTARAKGLSPRRVLVRHCLRNCLGPVLSVAGLQVALLLAGVVVIEQVFSWPGLGSYTAQALTRNDFPGIMGVTLVLGVAFVVINALVDIAQVVADPRLRSAT